MATPYDTIHLGQVDSTQDIARSVFPERGTVLVVADRQVGGRGRTGREWWEAPRALYSSLAFEPSWSQEHWGALPLVAGLAVRQALGDELGVEFGVEVGLKWPNDLVMARGKAGGILVESSGGPVVVGCGVNLWWPEPPAGAAAVCERDPGDQLAARLAGRWADDFLRRMGRPAEDWGRDEYRKACVTIGADVEWNADGVIERGSAADIDEWGGLMVEHAVLRSGEVRHIRGATLPSDSKPEGDGE